MTERKGDPGISRVCSEDGRARGWRVVIDVGGGRQGRNQTLRTPDEALFQAHRLIEGKGGREGPLYRYGRATGSSRNSPSSRTAWFATGCASRDRDAWSSPAQSGLEDRLSELSEQPVRPVRERPSSRAIRTSLRAVLFSRLLGQLLLRHIIQCRGHHGTSTADPPVGASGWKHRSWHSHTGSGQHTLRLTRSTN